MVYLPKRDTYLDAIRSKINDNWFRLNYVFLYTAWLPCLDWFIKKITNDNHSNKFLPIIGSCENRNGSYLAEKTVMETAWPHKTFQHSKRPLKKVKIWNSNFSDKNRWSLKFLTSSFIWLIKNGLLRFPWNFGRERYDAWADNNM